MLQLENLSKSKEMLRKVQCLWGSRVAKTAWDSLDDPRLSDEEAFVGNEPTPTLSLFDNMTEESPQTPKLQTSDFRRIAALYSPTLFAFGLFDSADIAFKMTVAGLVEEPIAKTIPRWLVSPLALVRDRALLSRQLGSERDKGMRQVLNRMLDEFDATISPLQRYLTKSNLCADTWTSFLRATVSVAVFQTDEAQLISGIIRACIDGELADSGMIIEGDQRDRAVTVGNLLIESSAEFGCPPITNLALEIFAKYHINCSYQVMRRVQLSDFRAGKRRQDWQLRGSGRLKLVAPLWFREYFPFIWHAAHGSTEGPNELASTESPEIDVRSLALATLQDLSEDRHQKKAPEPAHKSSEISGYFSKHSMTDTASELDSAIRRDAALNADLASKSDTNSSLFNRAKLSEPPTGKLFNFAGQNEDELIEEEDVAVGKDQMMEENTTEWQATGDTFGLRVKGGAATNVVLEALKQRSNLVPGRKRAQQVKLKIKQQRREASLSSISKTAKKLSVGVIRAPSLSQ